MSADYYYETFENGYYIKDRNNPYMKLKQYEPFIFHRDSEDDKDYQAIAQRHIEDLKKADTEAEEERITTEKLAKDLETTKGAIDTLMQVVMMSSTPMMLSADLVSDDKINLQKGADSSMAAYIAKRVIDLEAQQEGAGKAYYKLYLSSELWGAYKEEVDRILADLGHADLIMDLSQE